MQPPPSQEILIGVSTYDEIENLPSLVEQIDEFLPAADILVVDDRSPDGTGAWAQTQAEMRADFFCIQRPGKLGLGSATIATMQFAIDHDYRFLINMDADLSHPARSLPALYEAAQSVDVAVGSRYVPGGSIKGWPLHRKAMSRCVNQFARWALRLPTQDCSGSFRCYRVAKLREIPFDDVQSKGYSFFEEILWHLRRADATFVEVPIAFQDRRKGSSKINMGEALGALRVIASLSLRRA